VVVFYRIGLDGLLKNNWTQIFQWFGCLISLDTSAFQWMDSVFNGWIQVGFSRFGFDLSTVWIQFLRIQGGASIGIGWFRA
jgi:hypothetical protein